MPTKFIIVRTGTGQRTETANPQLAARFRKNPAFRVSAVQDMIEHVPTPDSENEVEMSPRLVDSVKPSRAGKNRRDRAH